jgi:hypothetical protein
MVARVQNVGLARITATLAALSWWLQWGTGTDPGAGGSSVNPTGTAEARSLATATQQTTTVTNDTLRLVATITETQAGPVAITQVGAFDSAGTGSPPPVGGNMDIYGDFAAINVSLGDSIQFTINTKFV